MAAGGGHWIKSPLVTSGNNLVFMPAIHETGGRAVLGKYIVTKEEGLKKYLVHYEKEGNVVFSNSNPANAILYAGVLQASHVTTKSMANKNKSTYIKGVMDAIDGMGATAGGNATMIYSAFLDYLTGFTAPPAVPATGGLFES